ncbi:hypothetical protein O181_054335 [Austropuccinia psidii MF-1]|uniref:Uncharacterized protein n=1 Tax=Austropuccinia psidii MF-1 TaxID=1389203 RepID=A0A9Q3E2A1_9BASI|nr:hypothetical protein [Austropuccinia psidii MF-1]
MTIQHSPHARQTRLQARTQAVLTPTPRAPLDGTPAVPQRRAQLDRGPHMEGVALWYSIPLVSVSTLPIKISK